MQISIQALKIPRIQSVNVLLPIGLGQMIVKFAYANVPIPTLIVRFEYYNTIMKRIAILMLLTGFVGTVFAQTKHSVTKSAITFEIKNMGFKCTGSFGGLQADVLFDKDHLNTSTITASVETKTVNTDDDMRDGHLKKEDYFDAEHFPKITLKSAGFKSIGGDNYTGSFDVTIKGITKRVELPFTYIVSGGTATFKGSFKINRLDFNVGDHSMILSNEATIYLDVTAAM